MLGVRYDDETRCDESKDTLLELALRTDLGNVAGLRNGRVIPEPLLSQRMKRREQCIEQEESGRVKESRSQPGRTTGVRE